MINNSNLQNDFIDTFSIYSKVNDTDDMGYPLVYYCFSNCLDFIGITKVRNKYRLITIGISVEDLQLNSWFSFNDYEHKTQYTIVAVSDDFELIKKYYYDVFFRYVKRFYYGLYLSS